MSLKVGWGSNTHPEITTAVWGARLIVTQDGYVDLVGDRQDVQGSDEARATLITRLNSGIIRDIKDIIGDLLQSGDMSTRLSEDFIVYMGNGVIAHANTAGSCGYCYVGAWLDTPTKPVKA